MYITCYNRYHFLISTSYIVGINYVRIVYITINDYVTFSSVELDEN